MDLSTAGRLLGQKPRQWRYERTCPICGKQLMATARGVCSPTCGAKAQRLRLKRQRQSEGAGEAEKAG